jgi:hypothetical protein
VQLALIDLPPQPREWDEREVYYSLPVYIWPLVEYLRRLAFDTRCYTWFGRHRRALARKWARQAFAGPFVEPCAGSGALVDGWCYYAAVAQGVSLPCTLLTTGDIRELPTDWCGDWCATDTGLWTFNRPSVRAQMGWEDHGTGRRSHPFSLVATNPPFTLAREVVEASWRHCTGITAILQRSSWYEPTEERGPWLRARNPDQLVIGRCSFRRPDGSSAGAGDSCSYSWFVWGPDKRGPLGGHHEILPWRDAPAIGGAA